MQEARVQSHMQQLRGCIPQLEDHMLQLKTPHMTQPKRIPHATAKTQHSQINKQIRTWIHKELSQFNNSKDKKKTHGKKWAKDLNMYFSKEDTHMVNEHRKTHAIS